MERQNVTLSLPKSLLKQAKVVAAQEDKSLSELIREALSRKVMEGAEYEEAKKRQIALMEKGVNLGTKGKIKFSRDKLYERR
jgi:metal-responsive CopG/Arc/MetJ family transcriptional regulator